MLLGIFVSYNSTCFTIINLLFLLKIPTFLAMVYGQGNVRMFDNTAYYVCGEGDFILLQSTMVTIEGRFQKSPFSRAYLHLVPNFISLFFITFLNTHGT